MQANNRQSAASMDRMPDEVKESERAVAEAGEAFGRILQSVRAVAEQMHRNSAASRHMSASTQRFSESPNGISELSAELAASVMRVNGSAHEQNSLICRSSELASVLAKLSDGLNEIIVDTKRNFSMG